MRIMTGLMNSLKKSRMDANNEKYGSVETNTESDHDIQIDIDHKRTHLVYCSNGTVECDEDGRITSCECKPKKRETTDSSAGPVMLPNHHYLNYLLTMTWNLGRRTLHACDYLGEKITSMLGITTPKYEFEINEYNRLKEEEKNYRTKQDAAFVGWRKTDAGDKIHTVQDSSAKQADTE